MTAGRVAPRVVGAFALTALFVAASAVGFGIIPADDANALTAPPPLPTSLSSELAATMGDGGFTASEAAATAGASGVAATGAAAGTGIAGAAVGAFVVTAGAVGVVMRATGASQSGLCSVGTWLGALYGADCTTAAPPAAPAYVPNTDASAGMKACNATGCVSVLGYTDSSGTAPNGTAYTERAYGIDLAGFDPTQPFTIYEIRPMDVTNAGTNPPVAESVSTQSSTTCPAPYGWFASAVAPAGNAAICVDTAGSTFDTTRGILRYTLDPSDTAATGPSSSTTQTGDPERYFESVATFADGTTASARSANFTESGTIPQYPEVLTGGKALVELVVTEWMADGSSSKLILDQKTSAAYQNATGLYPDCAGGACQLQVYVNGQPCAVGVAACEDWSYTPSTDPLAPACEYGPASNPTEYSPPLSECNVLTPYYRPQNQDTGTPFANPKTGTPLTTPTAKPQSGTTTTPSSSGSDCFGNAYGTFDPATWILAPVKCALQWAFVPTDAQTDTQKVIDAWKLTPVGQVTSAVGAWNFVPPGTGCGGVVVSLAFLQKVVAQAPGQVAVGAACPGDLLAPWAGWANLFLSVTIIVSSSLALIRIVAGVLSYDGAAVGGD